MIKLKALRIEKGLNQQNVADFLGISQPAYANYERQAREADYETLKKLSTFFDVSIDYLLGKEEKSSGNSNDLSNKIIETFNRLDDDKQQIALEYLEFLASRDNQEK